MSDVITRLAFDQPQGLYGPDGERLPLAAVREAARKLAAEDQVAAGIDGDAVEAHLPGLHDQRNHGRRKGHRGFEPFTPTQKTVRRQSRSIGLDPDRNAPADARQGRRAMAVWEAYAKQLGVPGQLNDQQRRDLEAAAEKAARLEADLKRVQREQEKAGFRGDSRVSRPGRKTVPADMDVQAEMRVALRDRHSPERARVEKLMRDTYEFTDEESGLTTKVKSLVFSFPYQVQTELVITDRSGKKVGGSLRLWKLRDAPRGSDEHPPLLVEHAFLQLKPSVQGGGFSKRFNARAEAVYREAGVEAIEIHANIDVGGYAWARQGYEWFNSDSMQALVGRLRVRSASVFQDDAERQAFLRLLDRATPANFNNDTAPMPIELALYGWKPGATDWPGKRLMLGVDWYGLKPLNRSAFRLAASAASKDDLYEFSLDLDAWHGVWTEEYADEVPVRAGDRHPNDKGESDYNEHHHDISAPPEVDDVFWFGAMALLVGEPTDRGGGGERVAAATPPAEVDHQALDDEQAQAVEDITGEWEQESGPLVEALAAAVAAEVAGGVLAGLAALAVPPAVTAALTAMVAGRLLTLGRRAAVQAAAEVAPIAKVPDALQKATRDRITDTARTAVGLIVAGYQSAAARVALNQAGTQVTAEQVHEAVTAALTDLSQAKSSGLVAGNVAAAAGSAQGAAREQVLGELPEGTRFRASEVNDANRCGPCREVDDREYDSLAAALADYPAGRYKGCDGRDRCRGFIYAVLPGSAGEVAAGIDGGTVAAHLPGRHNQGSHGNRFHKPGDPTSGLRRRGKERAPKKTALTGDAAMDTVPKGLFKKGTLTGPQTRALRTYETSYFRQINGSLRSGNVHPSDQRLIDAMDSAMDGSVLPEDVQVWRGMYTARELFQDSLDGDLTGFTWKELGYSSTSTEERVARDYMVLSRPQRGNVKVRVSVPAGVKGVQLSTSQEGSRFNGPQAEITLQRGLVWRIVKDHGVHPDGYRVLDAEVRAE